MGKNPIVYHFVPQKNVCKKPAPNKYLSLLHFVFLRHPPHTTMNHPEIIIDGYNLLHKLFPSVSRTNLALHRNKTESLLNRYQKQRKSTITVVYDGGGVRESSEGSSLSIVYTASSKSADNWIIDYVKSLNTNRKMVTIVSSDREVCRYGLAFGAKCMSSEEFLAILSPGKRQRNPCCPVAERKFSEGFLDSNEVDQWKRLFRHRKP